MNDYRIYTIYLFPVMIQILLITLTAAILRKSGVVLGYETVTGNILIVLAGISSALWGIFYQCRVNHKHFLDIVKDFFNIRQSIKSYLFIVLFLSIDFGGVILSNGFQKDMGFVIALLFLKALVFGGIEEIGWRYTFHPVMERKIKYIPAVILTFVCWGIWHFLFFYIDGSLACVNIVPFLAGLLTNCFILSALYAYSGSLWICVMTHAFINALSQTALYENVVVGFVLKIVCIAVAIASDSLASKQHMRKTRH